MAMGVRPLSSVQSSAAQNIYSGAYNYALGQGASTDTATNFANTMLGVSSGEGLYKPNPWSTNPDVGVTALGPFQLNLNNGVGADFGLNANSPPEDQMNAAFSTAYNGGNFNLGPWNTIRDTVGGSNTSALGQTTAANIGSQIASQNGFSAGNASSGAGSLSWDNSGGQGYDISALGPVAGVTPDAAGETGTGSGSEFPTTTGTGTGLSGFDYTGGGPAPGSQSGGTPTVFDVAGAEGQIPQMGQTDQSAFASGGGAPMTITNASDIGQAAGADIQKASNQVSQALTGSEQAAAATGTSWISSIESALGNLFVRSGFVLIGLLFLAGAFMFLYFQGEKTAVTKVLANA